MNSDDWNKTVKSPGKLNLGLRVVGLRPDGYHEIQSVFWPINLCDTMGFRKLESDASADIVEMQSDMAPVSAVWPSPKDNLVMRSLNEMRREKRVPFLGVSIRKQIPIGGGLGGGSSNSGTTLRHLNQWAGLALDRLNQIARDIGSDVPFFLNPSSPAWVCGRGEICTRLDVSAKLRRELHFILIVPAFTVSTAQVFNELRSLHRPFFNPLAPNLPKLIDWHWLQDYLAGSENTLQPLVEGQHPIIAQACLRLLSAGAFHAAMSGSGSTIYGAFQDYDAAHGGAKALSEFCRNTNCRAVVTTTYTE